MSLNSLYSLDSVYPVYWHFIENVPKLSLLNFLNLLSLPSLLALYEMTVALTFGNVPQLRDTIQKSLIDETNSHIARDSIY